VYLCLTRMPFFIYSYVIVIDISLLFEHVHGLWTSALIRVGVEFSSYFLPAITWHSALSIRQIRRPVLATTSLIGFLRLDATTQPQQSTVERKKILDIEDYDCDYYSAKIKIAIQSIIHQKTSDINTIYNIAVLWVQWIPPVLIAKRQEISFHVPL
jgi:hypothetical protein